MSLRFISLAFTPLLLAGLVEAQEPLRLHGLYPSGLRSSLTESWGTLRFLVDNNSDVGRPVRVVAYFPTQPDVRYARDVWVPARTSLGSWLSVGPVPAAKAGEPSKGRELEYLLYDLSDGKERLVLPSTEARTRSRAVMYRKREPLSVLSVRNDFLQVGTPAHEAFILAHTLRTAAGMPAGVTIQPEDYLPHSSEAFEGIDHFIVASDRIAADPVGTKALRQWLLQGGKVWVMLDLVDPKVVAHLLGEDTNIEVADRTSLTSFKIIRHRDSTESASLRTFEKPVDLVRVFPAEEDTILHSVNGWPVSFTRTVGRGKVLFTTLGARGWHKPRDPKAPKKALPNQEENLQLNLDLPTPLTPLEELSVEFRPKQKPGVFTTEDLRPSLDEQIGYSVLSRQTVMLILGGFLAVLLALGIGLRRSSRPELVGWLAPAAALAAAVVFFVLGERSRRAVPPTIAIASVTDVAAGTGEAASEGLVAFYQPDSGPAAIASRSDALLHLNSEGLDGQIRRRSQSDLDTWQWDQLSLPAGARGGKFRHSFRSGTIEAIGRFGEKGLEGKLTTPSFRNVSDLLLVSARLQPLAIRLQPDGSFSAADSLSPGQFLESAVLTDQQQKRQDLYRKLVQGGLPEHLENRDIVMAWAEPEQFPFTPREGEKTSGTSLLFVPLTFEAPAPGSQVSIPAPFISYRRIVEGKQVTPTMESSEQIAMDLRFQIPDSVRPLTLEKAILTVRVRAPNWKLVLKGGKEAGAPIIHQANSPLDAIRLELTDAKLLQLDDRGGWHLSMSLDPDGDKRSESRWKIEVLSLEVQGKTASK